MDNVKAMDASYVLSAVFDRKQQLMNMGNNNVDPFFLLKEVAQMSNFKNQQENLSDEHYSRQAESMAGYNSLVMKNFDESSKLQ